ncbi:MAG: choice-of-anchor D domain-containing protein [Terracidiphilus sp.]
MGNDPSRWIRNVPLYSEVDYDAIYPGISLRFYGNGQELEHDFHVDPGADPSKIVFRLDGPTAASMSPNGDLEIRAASGSLILRKPVAYQVSVHGREPVEAKFQVGKDGTIHFDIGSYDRSRLLVIDPVYVFSTYLAGTGTDQAAAVTTDASGNILVIGSTSSTDFPTANPLQPSLGSNNQSVFVSKFDPTGKTLIYSTYLGGSGQALGAPTATGGAIAVDATGNAILAGLASSSNFPQAGAIVSPSCQINDECYFLASLSADGSKLNYSGIIGGEEGFYAYGVGGDLAVDGAGNVYLAGTTDNSNFQITAGTLATSVTGYPYNEAFVLKVDPTGKLLYSTVIPGNDANPSDLIQPYTNDFIPSGIAVDASGDATIAGTTGLGLPTTAGVVGPTFPNAHVNVENPSAGFVLQLNPTASAINFASYLPGTDGSRALTVDPKGDLWIAGSTGETNLPVSANAYQKTPSAGEFEGISSGYIAELDPQATTVLAATYLDGPGTNQTYESSAFTSIALDNNSNVFVGGTTSSADFPMVDPFVTEIETAGTIWELILAEMSPDLSTVEFGSFLSAIGEGYSGSNFAGLAVDSSNNLIVTGTTYAANFPTTPGSFEPQLPPPTSPLSSPAHSFVAKFNIATPAPAVCLDTFAIYFGNVGANTPSTQTFHVTNCGNAALNISSITSSDPTVVATQSCGSMAPGTACPVTLTFTPVNSAATAGTVALSDNAVTIPQTVSFSGQGIAPKIAVGTNPLSFGHLVVGTPAVDNALFVQNQGQAALTVSGVTLSGSSFSIVNNGCTQFAVPSHGLCGIELAFAPAGAGTQNGSLVIASNDPATPQLTVALTGVGDSSYAVPMISSIGAGTVQINNGPATLQVTGSNFYPQSIAQLNGVAQATTFLNNGTLNVTLAASSLTSIGEQQLAIINPNPGGGASSSVKVTPYQTLVIDPAALASVPATGMIYAAIPASATGNPNTVIPIDPATGTMETPIPVGNNPGLLAASSNGSYLYVANQGDYTVQRINLSTNAVEATFPYTPNIYCSTCSNLAATDLETVPGNPTEVLLSQGDWLSLFNDSGLVNYVPYGLPCCYADPDFGSITLAGNPLTVYGLPFSFGGDFFQIANLTSSGLQYSRPSGNTGIVNNTTGSQVVSDGTLLYTSAGQIWNPATQTEIGTFPVSTFNDTSYPNMRNLNLDASLGEIYLLGDEDYQSINSSDAMVVSAYDVTSYALNGTLAFPEIDYPIAGDLVRWGSNGLAFIAAGAGQTDQELYLVESSVVSPQALNPAPQVTSISPTFATGGAPAFTLTVSGSSFVSASLVDWNGNALSTTFVSATQLTAAVPASDIASAGTAQVTVNSPTPGGGVSSAQTFTINAAVPAASLSGSTLSFGGVPQGVSSHGQNVTLTNSGTAPLTITSIVATGNFSETTTCGSSLAIGASCQISITFTPESSAALTGALTITDNAPNSPQTVSLSGTGLPPLSIVAASGGSTSATVSSGGTATYNLSLIGAAGFDGSVSLSCSGAPQYASCSINPTSINLSAGGSSNFTVTVTTGGSRSAAVAHDSGARLAGLGITALLFIPLFLRIRKGVRKESLFFGVICLFLSVSGCGGSSQSTSSPPVTSAGTYTLTIVAATSNSTIQQTLTLIVQ